MDDGLLENLPRKERLVLEILLRRERATAREVMADLDGASSYSAVRGLLTLLVSKGLAKHSKDGRHYIYEPNVNPDQVQKTALEGLLKTFFQGRPEKLVASLLSLEDRQLKAEEIERIRKLLD